MATNMISYATKHAVCASTRLAATTATGGDGIIDIKLSAAGDNGIIVGKGAYNSAGYYAEAAATTFTGEIIDVAPNGNFYVEVYTAANAFLVLNVPLIYEQYNTRMQEESNFYNASGDIVRGYKLHVGDVFELSAEGFDGTPVKNATVSFDATTKQVEIQ